MRYFGIIFSFFLLASISSATTIHVPADQPTIQAGIDAAAVGDTILVAPGWYNENLHFGGNNTVVTSQASPEPRKKELLRTFVHKIIVNREKETATCYLYRLPSSVKVLECRRSDSNRHGVATGGF